MLENYLKWEVEAVVQNCCVNKVFLKICKILKKKPASLLKNRPQRRCFPALFTNFLKVSYFVEHLQTAASEEPSF